MTFFFIADDWADNVEEEEEEKEEEKADNGAEAMEVESAPMKQKRKKKDSAAPSVKKEHVNVIFIGHVGKCICNLFIIETVCLTNCHYWLHNSLSYLCPILHGFMFI